MFPVEKFPRDPLEVFLYHPSHVSALDHCTYPNEDKKWSWRQRFHSLVIITYCSITGPISMGQCDALNAKHSVHTYFKMVFCCCVGNCWKLSFNLACFTQTTKICAITLKFNVWFAWNVNGIACEIRFVVCIECCLPVSSRLFDDDAAAAADDSDDWMHGFCFRGPRSSCTAFPNTKRKISLTYFQNEMRKRKFLHTYIQNKFNSINKLTIYIHLHLKATLEPTICTPITSCFVNYTIAFACFVLEQNSTVHLS